MPAFPATLNSTVTDGTVTWTNEGAAPDMHWGGELQINAGFTSLAIQGVEIEKFGKSTYGSYPIYLNQLGTPTPQPIINSNSIHHSYNKCVAINGSNSVTVANTVCARVLGLLQQHGTLTRPQIADLLAAEVAGEVPLGSISAALSKLAEAGRIVGGRAGWKLKGADTNAAE